MSGGGEQGGGREAWASSWACPHRVQSCSRAGPQCSPLAQAALQAVGPWGREEVWAKSVTPSHVALSSSPLAVATLLDTSWTAHVAARRRSTPTRTGPREQGHLCDAGRPRGSEFSCVTWGRHVALTELSGFQDVFRAAHPGRRIVPGRDRHARSAAAQGWELCVRDRDVLARVPLGQCWALDGR